MTSFRKNNNTDIRLPENSKVCLYIQVIDKHGYEDTVLLSSFVEKVNHDNSFLIEMPMYQNSYYPLRHDEVCLIYFTAELEKGKFPEMFAVPVCVTDKFEQENRTYVRMKPMGNVVQSQRRDCYRFPSMFVSMKRAIDEDTPPVSAKILDFSDGGMLLYTYEKINVGEILILGLNIGENESAESVVLSTERAGNGKRGFRVAVKFQNIDRQQKERFYRFIIEKQLEKKKI